MNTWLSPMGRTVNMKWFCSSTALGITNSFISSPYTVVTSIYLNSLYWI